MLKLKVINGLIEYVEVKPKKKKVTTTYSYKHAKQAIKEREKIRLKMVEMLS
jgi:hypothetical protein